jgi:hypothetical protein
MTLRHLFAINFWFAVFFGVPGSFFPRTWVLLYGLAPGEATTWVIRLAGGSLLGFSTLMWFGHRSCGRVGVAGRSARWHATWGAE